MTLDQQLRLDGVVNVSRELQKMAQQCLDEGDMFGAAALALDIAFANRILMELVAEIQQGKAQRLH